jgi:hypothetical protein
MRWIAVNQFDNPDMTYNNPVLSSLDIRSDPFTVGQK